MEDKMKSVPRLQLRRPSAVIIPRGKWLAVRILAVVAGILVVLLAIALAVVIILKTTPPYCSSGLESSAKNLENPGLFNDLTPKEMIAVRDYLLSQKRLNLISYENATVNSSYIFMISLQVPLKAAVLSFQAGVDRKPQRAAKVIVYRGDIEPPRVEEYVVGPLPIPKFYRVVTSPVYRRVPIPFTSRPVDSTERKQLKEFISIVTEELHSLFIESYNVTYHNCTPRRKNCIIFQDFAPRGTKSNERKTWFWAYRETEGFYLHPLGFAIQINHQKADSLDWSISGVIYNGQLFYELDDLIRRYDSGMLRKVSHSMDTVDAQFSTFTRRGHRSFDTPLRGPRLIEPDGHRYSVDDQFVHYFGWSFNFHMHPSTGLQILDVYFQGEKIAYEISLQDITAFYTGPEMAWVGLYGVSWLLGASSFELVPGIDCPATATFRDSYHFVNSGSPRRYKNSICIFEQTANTPLRRHYSNGGEGKFNFYGGLVSSNLVVRTIVSLWSCDYIIDYVFHLDATIELKISLTGYIQTTFDPAGQDRYGNRVHENVIGNLHQHLFFWKIDFDIETTSNRFQTLDMVTESGSTFWYSGAVNNTQLKFEAVLKENENEAIVKYDFDHPMHYIIYNMNADNKFNIHRGYRIINEAKSKFLLENSTVTNAAGWAKYQLAVTKYKDVEDSASSIYAQGDPFDPVLDFTRYLEDNDSIVDTDLVVWMTAGFHHIPRMEDVPSISTTANQARIFLRPYNFFNHCPSMAVSDALVIRRKINLDNLDADLSFETFGTDSDEPHCYQKEKHITEFEGKIHV
uniref:Amine oxidase n=1 Tax=Arion vulgaris TaxID=1028688 RepID=A0A0B6ZT74_9EUPU